MYVNSEESGKSHVYSISTWSMITFHTDLSHMLSHYVQLSNGIHARLFGSMQ